MYGVEHFKQESLRKESIFFNLCAQTLYKSQDASVARAVGMLPYSARFRLNCVPLWTCLQNLGHDGVVTRIKYSLDLVRWPKKVICDTCPHILQ